MKTQRFTVLALVSVLVLMVVLFGAWRYRSAHDPVSNPSIPLLVAAECDSAQTACAAQGEGFAVELRLGPGVQPMQPFAIQLRVLQGQLNATARVALQFQMRDMDMGQNRYALVADERGIWRGTAVLPVCSRGRSDWLAQLEIQDADRHWSAELPFTAVAP